MRINIGLVGSSKAGKTVYLATLMRLLVRGEDSHDATIPAARDSATVKSPQTFQFWTDCYKTLRLGRWPPHTGLSDLHTIEFDLMCASGSQHQVGLKDLSGESIKKWLLGDGAQSDEEQAVRDIRAWHSQCDAFLFLVAPTTTQESGLRLSELEVAEDDPQILFVQRLFELLKAAKTPVVEHPTAFIFTRADQFDRPEGREAELAHRFLGKPEVIQRQFVRHEFFWCTSTGPLDRSDPLNPCPRKGDLAPRNIVEPFEWLIEQVEERAARHRRKRNRAWVTLAASATCLVGATLAAGQYWQNSSRIRKAEALVARAQGAGVTQSELSSAIKDLDGLWGLGAGRLRQVRKSIADANVSMDLDNLSRVCSSLTALGGGSRHFGEMHNLLQDAVDSLTRLKQGEQLGQFTPDQRERFRNLDRELAGHMVPLLPRLLGQHDAQKLPESVALLSRWLECSETALQQRQSCVIVLGDALLQLEKPPVAALVGVPKLQNEMLVDLCRRHIEDVDPRQPSEARRRTRQMLAALDGERRRAIQVHAAHVEAAGMLDDAAIAATPIDALKQLDGVRTALQGNADATADKLQKTAMEKYREVFEPLLIQALRNLQESPPAQGTTLSSLAAAGPAASMGADELDQVLTRGLSSLRQEDLLRAEVGQAVRDFAISCGLHAQSAAAAIVSRAQCAAGKYGSAAAFLAGFPATPQRQAALAAVVEAADRSCAGVRTAWLDGEAATLPLKPAAARADPAGFIAAHQLLKTMLADLSAHDAKITGLGSTLAEVKRIEAAMARGGGRPSASGEGQQRLGAAVSAIVSENVAEANRLLEGMAPPDRLHLQRAIHDVQQVLIPAQQQLHAANETPGIAARLGAYAALPRDVPERVDSDVKTGLEQLQQRAMAQATEAVQLWERQLTQAFEAREFGVATQVFEAVALSSARDAARQLAPRAYAAAVDEVSRRCREWLSTGKGPLNVEDRALVIWAACWLPERKQILRVAVERAGAPIDAAPDVCGLFDAAGKAVDRLATDHSRLEDWDAIRRHIREVEYEYGASSARTIDQYLTLHTSNGQIDKASLAGACLGVQRKRAVAQELNRVRGLHTLSQERRWGSPERGQRVHRQLEELGALVAATPDRLPLSVVEIQVGQYWAIALELRDEKGASSLPVLPCIRYRSDQREALRRGIEQFMALASSAPSDADLGKFLEVVPDPFAEGFIVQTPKTLGHAAVPVVRVDSTEQNGFGAIYGDARKYSLGHYTYRAVAEGYRLRLIEAYRVLSRLEDANAQTPADLGELARSIQRLGDKVDLAAVRALVPPLSKEKPRIEIPTLKD